MAELGGLAVKKEEDLSWWAGGRDSTEFEVGRQWRQEAMGDRWELGFWVTV